MRNAMLTLKTTLKTATSGTLGSVLKPTLFAVLMWQLPRPAPCRFQHARADHLADVCGDAGRADAAVEAGRRRNAHVSGGRRGRSAGVRRRRFHHALVGPSAGFLIGFLPAAVVTSLLKGKARTDSLKHGVLTAARYLFACVAGCIVIDYLLGFIVQSAITGVALPIVAVASMGFIAGDAVKAVVASAVVAGLAKLK